MGTWKRDVTGGWASPSGAKAARRGARSGALLGAGAVLVMLAGCSSGPGASDAPTRGDTATWELRGDVSADSRTLEIGVTRLGCADGVTGAVLEPQVTYEEDRVVIEVDVEALDDGAYTCPSNDVVPVLVELDEQVGDRSLVDGACLDGDAVTTSFCVDQSRWP